MFDSTIPFGQSSTTGLFGSQSVFGQTNATSTNPFDSSTRNSSFCGTRVFGHSSSLAFDNPTELAAETSSTCAFCGSSRSFACLGSTPSQISPLGSKFQQTQPLYGSVNFLFTTPFIACSQPVLSLVSLLWVPQAPFFSVSQQPLPWGIQLPQNLVPQFPLHLGLQQMNYPVKLDQHLGCQVPPNMDPQVTLVFGGQSAPAFGSSSTPAYGSSSAPAFGSSSAPASGSTSVPAFGYHNNARSGLSTAPVLCASFAPCLGFGQIPFIQSMFAVGSNPFGTTPALVGTQRSTIGNQDAVPIGSSAFGQSSSGVQQGGSRVAAYTPTPEANGASIEGVMLQMASISAMPVYKDKSHEELRWEDYHHGDRGGTNSAGQPTGGVTLAASTQVNPFGSVSSLNPFSSTCSSAPPLATSSAPASSLCFSSPFGGSSKPVCSPSPSIVGSSVESSSAFSSLSIGDTQSSSLFESNTSIGQALPISGKSSLPVFSSSSSNFGFSTIGSSSAFASSPTLGNIKPSGLLQSCATSVKPTSSPFGLRGFSPFSGCTTPSFSSSPSIFSSSVHGSSSAFTSSFSTSNVPSSGLSQVSTATIGETTPTFGSSSFSLFGTSTTPFSNGSSTVASSSAASGSYLTCDNNQAGLSPSFNPSVRQTLLPFGLNSSSLSGSNTPVFSSAFVFGSSSSESSLGYCSPFSLGSGNTRSSVLFRASNPSFVQTSSPFCLDSSASSSTAFSSLSSISGSSVLGLSSPCGSSMTHGKPVSSDLSQSSTPSIGQTPPFQDTALGKTVSPFSFSLESVLLRHSPSNPLVSHQTTPTLSISSHQAAPVQLQTSSAFPDGSIGWTQPASCGSDSTSSLHGQDILSHLSPCGLDEEAAGISVETPVDQEPAEKDVQG